MNNIRHVTTSVGKRFFDLINTRRKWIAAAMNEYGPAKCAAKLSTHSTWIAFIGAAFFFALCWRSAASTRKLNVIIHSLWTGSYYRAFFLLAARFGVFVGFFVCCSGRLILLLVFVCMSTRNTANMKHAKSMFIFPCNSDEHIFCPFDARRRCALPSILLVTNLFIIYDVWMNIYRSAGFKQATRDNLQRHTWS